MQTLSVTMDPARFYNMVKLVRGVTDDQKLKVQSFTAELDKKSDDIREQMKILARAENALASDARMAMRTKNPFMPLDDLEQDMGSYRDILLGNNFVHVLYRVNTLLENGYHRMQNIAQDLIPGALLMSEMDFDGKIEDTAKIQNMLYEIELNRPTVQRFMNALIDLENARAGALDIANAIFKTIERYFQGLLNRHTVEGIAIQRDPIVTDIAISIFDNVDAHGEIQDGKNPDELSAYSLNKALIIGETLKVDLINKFISNPDVFIDYVVDGLELLWDTVNSFSRSFETMSKEGVKQAGISNRNLRYISDYDYRRVVDSIYDLNPNSINEKESVAVLTKEEKFNRKFRNETIARVVELLVDQNTKHDVMIRYILERKAELRKYFQEENTFYVCRVGSGNVFLGAAPGALEVIPGERPNVEFDDIIGSGFNDVKEFLEEVKSSKDWHDLFMATSPSKTTDKSNVLMIGPMGCGKSEILRAVGAMKDSIGIFAQGSDFLTCWKGEAEKNPKRLFEAGLKLQRQAKKHVHFLIDEIDSVINDDKDYGSNNLTLEFQILMDGVVHYPNLSVWGATNNPQRIPMPMIRRFSKVLVVGELDEEKRVQLMKHYVGYLPVKDFNEQAWVDMSNKLRGATGDVIRKVADHLWRSKMRQFVINHKKEAAMLTDMLNEEGKFNVTEFDGKERHNFRTKLGSYMHVSPADLEAAIDLHLRNAAIRSEIDTAVQTYDEARKFLAALN